MLRGNRLSESVATYRDSFISTSAPSDPSDSFRPISFGTGLGTGPRRPAPALQRLNFAREPSLSLFRPNRSRTEDAGAGEGPLLPSRVTPTQAYRGDSSRVTLETIIEGKTCSPASLFDLQEFARWFDEQGTEETGGTKMVDVLAFLLAFNEYRNRFEALPAEERNKSPSPFAVISLLTEAQKQNVSGARTIRRRSTSLYSAGHKPLPLLPLFFDRSSSQPSVKFNLITPERGSGDASTSTNRTGRQISLSNTSDFALSPVLRYYPSGVPPSFVPSVDTRRSTGAASAESKLDPFVPDIAHEVFSSIPRPVTPQGSIQSPRKQKATSHSHSHVISLAGSQSSTQTDSSSSTILPSSIDPSSQPLRNTLATLMALSLSPFSATTLEQQIPAQVLSQTLLEAKYTTHPGVLAPVCAHLYNQLEETLLPPFMIVASQKLAVSTYRGRLVVSFFGLVLTIALVVLLIISPSPLTGNRSTLPKEVRLLCFPLLFIVVGYAMAARTRRCFWLGVGDVRGTQGRATDEKQRPSRWVGALGFAPEKETAATESVLKTQEERLTAVTALILVGVTTGLQVIILFIPVWEVGQ